jgi:ubiquitin-like protein Nedd8
VLHAGEGLTATLSFFSLVMRLYERTCLLFYQHCPYIIPLYFLHLYLRLLFSLPLFYASCIACIGVIIIYLIRLQPTIIIGKTNIYQIFIKTLTGRKQAFNFEPENQVLAVKQALQEKEGIQVDQIRLIFSGKQLSDDRTLESYTINAGATIHMVLQLRGGGIADKN